MPTWRPHLDPSWRSAIFAFLAILVSTAALKNSGFIYVGFMDEFGINREKASWPSSVLDSALHGSAILLSLLNRKFTLYRLSVVGSILAWSSIIASSFAPNITSVAVLFGIHGFGIGTIYVTFGYTLMAYFDKYRGAASGMLYAGETACALIFPKLLLHLQETYSFRNMFFIYGAIAMHATPLCILLGNPHDVNRSRNGKANGGVAVSCEEADHPKEPPGSTASTNTKGTSVGALVLFKRPMFYVALLMAMSVQFSKITFLTTIVDYTIDRGSSLGVASAIIVYTAPADLFGRVVVPLVADWKHVRREKLIVCCFAILSCSLFILPYTRSFWLFLCICMCLCSSLGGLLTTKMVLAADRFDMDLFTYIIGFMGLSTMPLLLAAPSVIGFFRDGMGSYDNLYILLASINLLMSLIFGVVVLLDSTRQNIYMVVF